MGGWDFLYDMANEGCSAEDIMEAQTSGASPEQWGELERQEKKKKTTVSHGLQNKKSR